MLVFCHSFYLVYICVSFLSTVLRVCLSGCPLWRNKVHVTHIQVAIPDIIVTRAVSEVVLLAVLGGVLFKQLHTDRRSGVSRH